MEQIGTKTAPSKKTGSKTQSKPPTPAPVAITPPDPSLLPFARLAAREIRLRSEAVPLIDELRWMILLEVFLAMGEGRDTPFMSAAHASSAPVSSAQRFIHQMTEQGLIVQHRSDQDQRIMHVSLTDIGTEFVSRTLKGMLSLRSRI